MNSANFYFIHKNTNSVLNVYFEILQPVVHHSNHLYHMEKSENFRLIESVYIQEPIQMPVEITYFPAIAIIKLKKKMVNLNSMVLTFDGPLYSDKNYIYHPNGGPYSGTCYSHASVFEKKSSNLLARNYRFSFTPVLMTSKSFEKEFCQEIADIDEGLEHVKKYKDVICSIKRPNVEITPKIIKNIQYIQNKVITKRFLKLVDYIL